MATAHGDGSDWRAAIRPVFVLSWNFRGRSRPAKGVSEARVCLAGPGVPGGGLGTCSGGAAPRPPAVPENWLRRLVRARPTRWLAPSMLRLVPAPARAWVSERPSSLARSPGHPGGIPRSVVERKGAAGLRRRLRCRQVPVPQGAVDGRFRDGHRRARLPSRHSRVNEVQQPRTDASSGTTQRLRPHLLTCVPNHF